MDELLDDIGPAVDLPQLEDGGEPGIPQAGQQGGLAPEAPVGPAVGIRDLLLLDLDRVGALAALGAIDDAVGAPPDLLLNLKPWNFHRPGVAIPPHHPRLVWTLLVA